MRRLRELLRLKYEAGLTHRAIARACAMGLGTVTDLSAARRRPPACRGRCPTISMTRRWKRACLPGRRRRRRAIAWSPTGGRCIRS